MYAEERQQHIVDRARGEARADVSVLPAEVLPVDRQFVPPPGI